MTSRDVSEEHLERDSEGGHGSTDEERLALALRWAIGRSPQTDEDADRRLLRAVSARLAPDLEPTPTALDAHLADVLAEIASTDELVDHAEPRHRRWIGPIGRIYLCPPESLPEDLKRQIGSDLVLRHLSDGVSNRARAAAKVLEVAESAIRVRREPPLLRAAAAALVDRIEQREQAAPDVAPHPPAGLPAQVIGGGLRPRWRWPRLVAAVAAAAVIVGVVVAVGSGGDGPGRDGGTGGAAVVAPARPLPAVGAVPSVLGLRDGALVAVSDAGTTSLGLRGVVDVDAHREDEVVHVVAELEGERLVYGAVGRAGGRWINLGTGRRAPEIGVDRTGRPVIVAIEGDQGDLARTVMAEGRSDGGWQPLAATGAVHIDMATNQDGRLEVGGVSTTGTAFNIWQTGAPGGWSNYSDPRAGEDGERVQAVSNHDGRLELFVERADGSLWNTWQEAPGRSWRTGWDPRYFEGLRQWRVAVGPDSRLIAVALTDAGVLLRRQVPVTQADGTTKLMWPPSTMVDALDPLEGTTPDSVTVVAGDDDLVIVASGAGRTVALDVGPDGVSAPRDVAPTGFDALVPVDG